MTLPNSYLCSIVIPIYKRNPDASEVKSLKQALDTFGAYDFFFVCSDKLIVDHYISLLNGYKAIRYVFVKFDDQYFESTYTYNRLMLSKMFYAKFVKFKYILIYQLDVWVFRNELEYWCNREFDYIGAPWFSGYNNADAQSQFIGVGNGGFSLRNVKKHLRVLNSFGYVESPVEIWKKFKKNIGIRAFISFLKDITTKNNTFFLFNDYGNQEDFFWGLVTPTKFKWFKIPDMNTAMQFSMEVNAPMLYKLNNNKLPFGCHAWEKYHKDFWDNFIK